MTREKVRRGYRELHATHPRVIDSPIDHEALATRPYSWTGEHRVVMAYELGRELLPSEHVHHLDGNKMNNTPRNLRVYSAADHKREHQDVIADLHRLRTHVNRTQQGLIDIALNALRLAGCKPAQLRAETA